MIILDEIERIEEQLVQTDPTDPKYPKLLTVLGQLATTIRELKDLGLEAEETKKEETPVPWKEEVPFKEEPKAKESTLTFDEVRTICTEAMGMGVKLQPIVAKYVEDGQPAKLTNVDPSNYDALVKEVREEANNAR